VNLELFLALVFLASIGAGLLGALVGLGGGILIVPLLTIGFGLDIRLAIGASIVSVIATSSGAGAALVRDRLTNIRIATLLQLATSAGAVIGAFIAPYVAVRLLFVLFGILLLVALLPMVRKVQHDIPPVDESHPWALQLGLPASYPDAMHGETAYAVTGVPAGLGLMLVAGLASGLLGIGSGALKVLAMDTAMRLPIKVSSATSNFMIGVTAAASAGVYFWRGEVLPLVAAPVALGVLLGSVVGARFLVRFRSSTVRIVFMVVLAVIAVQMLLRGAGVL
jgi:uncharacterized membrane protein YfcA